MNLVISVEGMMCTHCKARVEKALLAVPGTESALADLEKKNVTVTGTAGETAWKEAITAAGYKVVE